MSVDEGRSTTAPRERFGEIVARLQAAQKRATPGTPPYGPLVNRPLGRRIAAAAYLLGLSPNQVTGIGAVLSAAGIATIALARPGVVVGIAVMLLLLLGYAFDSADGQLARLTRGGTPAGEWLDHVVDSAKCSALHLAVLIGWYRFYDTDRALLLLPLGYTLAAAVFFFAMILTDQIRRAHPASGTGPGEPSRAAALVRSVLVLPTDYGILCLTFVLLGWQVAFTVAYSIMLAGMMLFLAAALPKWYRESAALGAEEVAR